MNIIKKSLLFSLLVVSGFISVNYSFAQTPSASQGSSTSNMENCEGFGADFEACGIGDIKGVAGTSSANTTEDKLVDTIKNFINRVLGILSLIAFVILLRGGFQMVTAAGDDGKYKEGMKILKQAAAGLIFVGLSWLIVSMIFRIISLVTKP